MRTASTSALLLSTSIMASSPSFLYDTSSWKSSPTLPLSVESALSPYPASSSPRATSAASTASSLSPSPSTLPPFMMNHERTSQSISTSPPSLTELSASLALQESFQSNSHTVSSTRSKPPSEITTQHQSTVHRSAQNVPPSTDFLSQNSPKSIQDFQSHLFSPQVQPNLKKLFQSRVEWNGKKHFYPSLKYSWDGFWKAWKRGMEVGVPTGVNGEKIVLFSGDDADHLVYTDDVDDKNAGSGNSTEKGRSTIIPGYEYGLANMAAFLSQVMVDGIYDDNCDELNEDNSNNACGQFGQTYHELTCAADSDNSGEARGMECNINPQMAIISSDGSSTGTSPAMQCGPQTSQGCCWWGRGPLSTKGPCQIGKFNYYLGKRAFDESRISANLASTYGAYPDIDFCSNPEVICNMNKGGSEDLRWSVGMFEWMERVQRYRSTGGDSGEVWDYKEKLVDFVNSGMNHYDYDTPGEEEEDENEVVNPGKHGRPPNLHSFIDSVSSIVNRGCHHAHDSETNYKCKPFPGPVHKLAERRLAFRIALSILRIPRQRENVVVEDSLKYLKKRKEGFETNLLIYKGIGGGFSASNLYRFDNFVDALARMSQPHHSSKAVSSTSKNYFSSPHHSPFYTGNAYVRHGHKYGLANIALFFANGLDISIESEQCDEHNEYEVIGKLPLSNSCGQRGLSYQDMTCVSENIDMSCPVVGSMEIEAVTFGRSIGSPPPLQCAPKTVIPWTGYWDADQVMEVKKDAYANDNGRVDVEGCCWWGRGILQTKGICAFGKLNYYLGKRAFEEGRNAMYPQIDFCKNPESICANQFTHELIWISGLFDWIDRVQNYNEGGFNYLERLHAFADTGFNDAEFMKAVGRIVKVGCHNPPCANAGCLSFPCDGAYPDDENTVVTKTYRTVIELNLQTEFPITPGGTFTPTSSPAQCEDCTWSPTTSPINPTPSPSKSPFVIPTATPSESPSRLWDVRMERFEAIERHFNRRRHELESQVFVSQSSNGLVPSRLYTLDGFLSNLKDLATKGIEDSYFFLGLGVEDFKQGLVNVGLFLAHAMTRGILWDTCEEVNHNLVEGKLPLSNACGQFGNSYSDDVCPMSLSSMECAVDPEMSITQASVGNSDTPAFFCSPKTSSPFTGYYEPISGVTVSDGPFSNSIGRNDVEGCCWWGRGILLTGGVCELGQFNHIYGLPAFKDSRPTGRYNIDFCLNPEAFCSNYTLPSTGFNQFAPTIDTTDIRYLHGMLHWIVNIQNYEWGFYNYMERLKQFVDGGMVDDSFVDDFSNIIVNSPYDSSLRKNKFKDILNILKERTTLTPSKSPIKTVVETTPPSVSPVETNQPSLSRPPAVSGPNSFSVSPPFSSEAITPQGKPPNQWQYGPPGQWQYGPPTQWPTLSPTLSFFSNSRVNLSSAPCPVHYFLDKCTFVSFFVTYFFLL